MDGTRWSWFDGACDNLPQLARQFELPSTCDIRSVLLSGWQERREALLTQIEGDFAFVLFDGEQLVLARDALGSRPLHYVQDDEGLKVARGPLALARATGALRPDPVKLAGFVLNLSEEGGEEFFRRSRVCRSRPCRDIPLPRLGPP